VTDADLEAQLDLQTINRHGSFLRLAASLRGEDATAAMSSHSASASSARAEASADSARAALLALAVAHAAAEAVHHAALPWPVPSPSRAAPGRCCAPVAKTGSIGRLVFSFISL
jgi:hypothetical protein